MSDRSGETVAPRSVAFLGLGVMGYPMAGHLARAGHRVTVYNRTTARAEAWVAEHGGRSAPTASGVAFERRGVAAAHHRQRRVDGADIAARERRLGAAQSWQMDQRGPTMIAGRFDFGFAVDWMRKDLGLVLDEARRKGARVPVTALVDQFYADVQAADGRRWDTSSLITRLR